jgi:SAM-dependent methyltransferase
VAGRAGAPGAGCQHGWVTDTAGGYRLYGDLAEWWPLISPLAEYAAEAAYLAGVFRAAPGVRDVLDLGSGGGHVAAHLRGPLSLTLVDLSGQMLTVSRRLNPGCPHIQGDMRTIRLGRMFDAVLVHDAIDYVTTEDDLRKVIETAFAHCRPGGLAVFVPDHTAERFQPGTGGGGSTDETGRQGSFREWAYDPDPADEWIQVDYEFVLREPGGQARVVRETHRLGAFRRSTWLRLLAGAGFRVDVAGTAGPDGAPGNVFIGRRPAGCAIRKPRPGKAAGWPGG